MCHSVLTIATVLATCSEYNQCFIQGFGPAGGEVGFGGGADDIAFQFPPEIETDRSRAKSPG